MVVVFTIIPVSIISISSLIVSVPVLIMMIVSCSPAVIGSMPKLATNSTLMVEFASRPESTFPSIKSEANLPVQFQCTTLLGTSNRIEHLLLAVTGWGFQAKRPGLLQNDSQISVWIFTHMHSELPIILIYFIPCKISCSNLDDMIVLKKFSHPVWICFSIDIQIDPKCLLPSDVRVDICQFSIRNWHPVC